MIKTPSGRRISGDYLTTIFDHAPDAVRQFQVCQSEDYSIELRVVPSPAYPGLQQLLAEVKTAIIARAHGELDVRIIECQSILHDRGKQRYVISKAGELLGQASDVVQPHSGQHR
jgi:phenylacetate-CoA ligase